MKKQKRQPLHRRMLSPPHKKMKLDPSPSWCPLLSLPDDMTLNCLARVPKSDHGALSLATKSYRSLVASSDLYTTRSLMGLTETYVTSMYA
ncbi:unnamed protein product [Arabis nemorensis]|uniref:F-box domain-containing protein n=1 Tax=Arabis nemorensis TaxID=586526 RepID=A0A565BSZ5_9BRAS|nr:unnamed protein product [Arabis nemorensis]